MSLDITANPISGPTNLLNASGTATNVNPDGTVKASGGSLADKNQFLMLLVNELQNQDPTAPVDQKETLSQLAQFSSLEQIQNLNQNLTSASGLNAVAQSAALIGKTVTTMTSADPGVSGIVSSVALRGGKTYLHVGAQDIDSSTITGIQ